MRAAVAKGGGGWRFRSHAEGSLRLGELTGEFFDAGSVAQLHRELRPAAPAALASRRWAGAASLTLLNMGARPAGGAAAASAGGGAAARVLQLLATSPTPLAAAVGFSAGSLVPEPELSEEVAPGAALVLGPELMAPMRVAQHDAVVCSALPPSADAPSSVPPGASYGLSRLGGEMGAYLALTGRQCDAVEALHAGLLTHVLDEGGSKPLLLDSVCSLDRFSDMFLGLDYFAGEAMAAPSESPLMRWHITECFSGGSVDEILARLGKAAKGGWCGFDQASWAEACLAQMERYPADRLELTLRSLREAAALPALEDCLAAEHAAGVLGAAPSDGPLVLHSMEPRFPFDGQAVQHLADENLQRLRALRAAKAQLGAKAESGRRPSKSSAKAKLPSPSAMEAAVKVAEADVKELRTLRGALRATAWTSVQSRMLDNLDEALALAEDAGVDVGPMGVEAKRLLRCPQGRQILQPYIEEATKRDTARSWKNGPRFQQLSERWDTTRYPEMGDVYREVSAAQLAQEQQPPSAKPARQRDARRRGGKPRVPVDFDRFVGLHSVELWADWMLELFVVARLSARDAPRRPAAKDTHQLSSLMRSFEGL